MNIEQLVPLPGHRTLFAWSHHRGVPEQPGCYALASFKGDVLYVGLASTSIQSRMGNHLDTPEKREAGALGAPYWFFYHLCEQNQVNAIEKGWLNQAILIDAKWPILNKINSPA